MPILPSAPAHLVRSANGVFRVEIPAWSGFPWLWHGFSTCRDGLSRAYLPAAHLPENARGQLNLGFTTADTRENVQENRLRWIEAVTGSRQTPLRTIRQIHSCVSVMAETWDPVAEADAIPQADGLMTGRAGLLLGVMTADCIPVLVADPAHRAVAAFHAGWRGTVARIVELGIARMQAEFGSVPAQLIAAIGPGIGACCYAVGPEVEGRFGADFAYAPALFHGEGDSRHLDLTEANRRQLLSAGLSAGAIAVAGGCTACQPDWFYSHRASGGHAGRMMASIGVCPD